MTIMTIELAQDLISFQLINQKSFCSDAQDLDLATAAKEALRITKKHINPISTYFGTQLERTALSFKKDLVAYHFSDKNEAAETFIMNIIQTTEPERAERVAYLTINLMLNSLNRKSAFKNEEDNIAATILIANTIDNYRRSVAHEIIEMGKKLFPTETPQENSKNNRIDTIKKPHEENSASGFSLSDRCLLQELASVVGNEAGYPGFTDFRDIPNAFQACGIGVEIKGQRVIFASFVGGYGPNGFECSVRNFNNEPVPGLPSLYPSLGKAIGAHRDYFAFMAGSFRTKTKPWWKRLFQ